jgi:hypothetical protein
MRNIEVIHGDTVAEMLAMPEESADAGITDPPFGIGYAKNIMGDRFRSTRDFQAWTTTWARAAYRVIKTGGWLICCMANKLNLLAAFVRALEDAGFYTGYQPLIWAHPAGFSPTLRLPNGARRGFSPARQCEIVVVAAKGKKPENYLEEVLLSGIHPGNLIYTENALSEYPPAFDLDAWWPPESLPFLIVPRATKGELDYGLHDLPEREIFKSRIYRIGVRRNAHPCPKPIKLMMYLLELFTRETDRVLEPFLGSGTTAIACEVMNRRCVGIEMNAEFCDIAQRRIKAWETRVAKARKDSAA